MASSPKGPPFYQASFPTACTSVLKTREGKKDSSEAPETKRNLPPDATLHGTGNPGGRGVAHLGTPPIHTCHPGHLVTWA